jgi:transcriptional regulator with XRE-family HTH domain
MRPTEPDSDGFERQFGDLLPIGPRLRAIRQQRGLTLEQVASEAGLTRSFLSLLERDATSASVASLQRICAVLGVHIAALLEPTGQSVLRKAARTPISFGGSGVIDYVLTPPDERRLQVFETHLAPGGSAGELFTAEIDIDLIYVLDGRLEFEFSDRSITLNAGDALTFSPREPHTWRNPSATDPTILIIASTPAAF